MVSLCARPWMLALGVESNCRGDWACIQAVERGSWRQGSCFIQIGRRVTSTAPHSLSMGISHQALHSTCP